MKHIEDKIKEYMTQKKKEVTFKEAFDIFLELPEGKSLLLEVKEHSCKNT